MKSQNLSRMSCGVFLAEGKLFAMDVMRCCKGRERVKRCIDTETIRVEKSVMRMLLVRVASSVVLEFGCHFVFGCSFQCEVPVN